MLKRKRPPEGGRCDEQSKGLVAGFLQLADQLSLGTGAFMATGGFMTYKLVTGIPAPDFLTGLAIFGFAPLDLHFPVMLVLAGAITAALFLREFVPAGIPWAHFDSMAWNLKTQPGRPEGGEAMGLRAVFGWLEQRYGGG